MLSLKDLSNSYKGAIIPHLINQEVIFLNTISYKKPNFWVREKTKASSEVDLVFQYKDMVMLIEIKSGKIGKLRSLHQFIDKSNHPYAIRMYAGEFKVEKHKNSRRHIIFFNESAVLSGNQITRLYPFFCGKL